MAYQLTTVASSLLRDGLIQTEYATLFLTLFYFDVYWKTTKLQINLNPKWQHEIHKLHETGHLTFSLTSGD